MTTLTREEKIAAKDNDVSPENVDEVLQLEEMALMYTQLGGADPRAVEVVEAAKAAGRIVDDKWVGPGSESPDKGA